jgi:hypothetical protein
VGADNRGRKFPAPLNALQTKNTADFQSFDAVTAKAVREIFAEFRFSPTEFFSPGHPPNLVFRPLPDHLQLSLALA